MNRTRSIFPTPPRAFTIIELLVVTGIIAVLMGILLVAFGTVRRSAELASAERFLASVGQAIQAFERDLGYLPPLLVYDGGGVPLGNQPDSANADPSTIVPEARWASAPTTLRTELDITRYGSEFTLAVYLLGTGDINNSEQPNQTVGLNDAEDDGQAGPGFRDPGPDRSWGGAAGRQTQRDNRTAMKIGRVYGPYLDPAGLSDHLRLDTRTGLFKLLDQWGQPIRYYRGWPTTDRPASGQPPRQSVEHTPVELRTADAVQAQIDDPQGRPDLELDRPIFTAPFMVVSAGRPVLFGSNDQPIPLFGDRRRDIPTQPLRIDDLPVAQNLSQPFNPLDLPGGAGEGRELLIEDLKSNLRHRP